MKGEKLKVKGERDRYTAASIGKKLIAIYDSCLHRDI